MDNTQSTTPRAKCQVATALEAEILESATRNLTAYRKEREAAGNPSEWKEPAYTADLWANRRAAAIGEALLADMPPTEIDTILGEEYRITVADDLSRYFGAACEDAVAHALGDLPTAWWR